MQIPIINGIYTDNDAGFRTSYPRNLVPVPKISGISKGYLRPAWGVEQIGAGPGIGRGGINWKGALYRVMGSSLVRVDSAGTAITLGEVGGSGPVTLDYSFDRLAIASGGKLFYWDGATLTQVTDSDLGTVVDVKWIAGYFMTTDGTNLVVTELDDPYSVNPTKYGSSEADPDPVMAVDELRNEAYAFNRYTIEVFDNVGGSNFPFQVLQGALIPKGVIGTHAYCNIGDTFVFLGSGHNEAPAVYAVVPGNAQKLSTAEIDQILLGYSESELSTAVMETVADRNHQFVYLHLPDQCLVYDLKASAALGELVWFTLDSGVGSQSTYRARDIVWCYDQWNCNDPTSTALGCLTDSISTHYSNTIGWEFGTQVLYVDGNGAIIHELELVALPGRVALGDDPVIWTSYSLDGETWSQERPVNAGKQGERNKRIAWRKQGKMQNYRIQKFRGTSDAHLSVARLEAAIEPLFTRPRNG